MKYNDMNADRLGEESGCVGFLLSEMSDGIFCITKCMKFGTRGTLDKTCWLE